MTIPAVLDPNGHRDATLPPEPPRSGPVTLPAACAHAPLLPRVSHRLVIRVMLRAEEIRRGLMKYAESLGAPKHLSAADAVWLAGDASDRAVAEALRDREDLEAAMIDAAAWALLAATKVVDENVRAGRPEVAS